MAVSPTRPIRFPLYSRAEAMGVLDGKSALIVAPTATGKSHIGREAIRRAVRRERDRTHAYLVPFRALASEVFEAFQELLHGTETRVRIVTGDHRDPVRPDQSDLVVATYESFVGLMHDNRFRPGVVVADEVHLVADDHRGPVVEGLFARLLSSGQVRVVCALSAIVDNADAIADWLGVPLLQGSPDDRPVPLSLNHVVADDLDEALLRALGPCRDGAQALVFCSSRPGAEKAARLVARIIADSLSSAQRTELDAYAAAVEAEDPDAADVAELMRSGVACHHAGLPKSVRALIERAFRERGLRVITGTTTLAAGVNLPAEVAIVRDIFRSDKVRGRFRRVLLPAGEVLNMLGRAGRPHQVAHGSGIALVEKEYQQDPAVRELLKAIRQGRGGVVTSRLSDSFEGLMRFVLDVIVARGEATRRDVVEAFKRTLAYAEAPQQISLDRPLRDDIMEDMPSYQRVIAAEGAIRLASYRLSAEGVHAVVASDEKRYEVKIGVTGVDCTCPARKFYRGEICKHQACAIHELLFGARVAEEARLRTLYNCGHIFGPSLDLGTRLNQVLDILTGWHLVERVPGGWRATPLGKVAAPSGFDLLFVHQAAGRIATAAQATWKDIAGWSVEDYFADEKEERRWMRAIREWIEETEARKIRLPTKYRGDFERTIDDLGRVCLLYERAAAALGNTPIARAAREAAGAVRYGVAPELVPLMALGFRQLARARARFLYERGIKNLQDLVMADPATLADPRRAPESLIREWVERAREIHEARAVATADRIEADAEFDELTARFRLDPAALA